LYGDNYTQENIQRQKFKKKKKEGKRKEEEIIKNSPQYNRS
jgi:hypothetical protein